MILVGLFGLVSAAHATPVTTYSYFYVAIPSSYTVPAGSPVSVQLYLQEENSDGSSNSLVGYVGSTGDDGGLGAAGISAALFSGSTDTTITGITPSPAFDSILDSSNTNTTAGLLEQVLTNPGVLADSQSGGVANVFLGTLMLQASSTPGQTTTFTLGAYDPNNGNTVTYNSNYDLDNNADVLSPPDAASLYSDATPTNFTVTTSSAVPEPASVSLLVAGALLLIRRSRSKAD
jgi:hypothetical protein